MSVKLAKDSIDLAIVTANADAMTSFYRDVLGFEYLGEMANPVHPRRLREAATVRYQSHQAGDVCDPPAGRAPAGESKGRPGIGTGQSLCQICMR
jgi:catechol 2,3-dioxygenase-like lactoylglutathione lyase family enzyme